MFAITLRKPGLSFLVNAVSLFNIRSFQLVSKKIMVEDWLSRHPSDIATALTFHALPAPTRSYGCLDYSEAGSLIL
ncbi:hypothetical protein [Microcoleus sp. FACHB-672]|uniref:hypothetical protein n=1 Tax=Microcoleus sp. FACHB-672 TaxID=2692825 RepID=UPI001687B76C|nr:hypothetical protein [Microcoleus sp. FACHB-672]MBD2042066.1 hypothetical protein [Microcoleus sp. FACHB-672]